MQWCQVQAVVRFDDIHLFRVTAINSCNARNGIRASLTSRLCWYANPEYVVPKSTPTTKRASFMSCLVGWDMGCAPPGAALGCRVLGWA